MRKRIVSIVLVALMLISMACVGIVSTSAADTVGTIYLQLPQQWIEKYGDSAKKTAVYAHIWVNGGQSNTDWQVSAEKMTRVSDGLWAYELTNLPDALKDGTQPQWDMVIFSIAAPGKDENGNRVTIGEQTYDTTLYPECIGKTFTIDTSVSLENPMDSSKKGVIALCEGTPSSRTSFFLHSAT